MFWGNTLGGGIFVNDFYLAENPCYVLVVAKFPFQDVT